MASNQDNRQDHWSILVKPTHDCNLNCKYCYDETMRRKYHGQKMSFEMIDHILNLATKHARSITWIWHGGEPTLMGTEWYKEVQELFYKYADKSEIKQSLQSNGTMLDCEWAVVNKDYGIDIGISYDVFDQDVRTGSNMNGLEEIICNYKECGGNCGAITVINRQNYKKQIDIYNYHKEKLKSSCSFNHVFSTNGTKKNELEIPADEYSKEFKKFFKYWINDASDKAVTERTCDIFVNLVGGRLNPICSYSDCRHNWISVNPAGVIYPCDRYVPEKYEMGNIMDYNSIAEVYENQKHKLYSLEIQQRLVTHCRECGYLQYCKGGCNANHITVSGDGTGVDGFSCELFRQEFNIVYDVLRNLEIYEKNYNPNFVKFLITEPLFTINEIKEFMSKKGFYTDWKYVNDGKQLLECQEFKMFRIFNNVTDGEGGHINYIKPKHPVDINLQEGYDLNSIKDERFKAMDKMFMSYFEEILTILRN